MGPVKLNLSESQTKTVQHPSLYTENRCDPRSLAAPSFPYGESPRLRHTMLPVFFNRNTFPQLFNLPSPWRGEGRGEAEEA